MAMCPTLPDVPSTIANQALSLIDFPPMGPLLGDYGIAVAGTRNAGSGVIRVNFMPKDSAVITAQLVFNVYLDNSQPDPTFGFSGPGGSSSFNAQPISISGSTCWLNPGGELTTYLRNRVYAFDVTSLVNGNGKYTVTGLPPTSIVNLAMPIGSDGDRLPGCTSSQGAGLFIGYENPNAKTVRTFALYAGSVLITPNPATWGGPNNLATQNYTKLFDAIDHITDQPCPGNGRVTFVAGDIHPSIGGVQMALNSVQFVPPNSVFNQKCGNSVGMKNYSVQLFNTDNQLQVASTGNCINAFMFAWSGDTTPSTEKFTAVSCAATKLINQMAATSGPDEVTASPTVTDQPTIDACHFGVVGKAFGTQGVPFYIKIEDTAENPSGTDGEIMQVYSSITGEIDDVGVFFWGVNRGPTYGGSTPVPHAPGACIRLVMSNRSKNAMLKNYAGKGVPYQRPNAGRWQGRFATC